MTTIPIFFLPQFLILLMTAWSLLLKFWMRLFILYETVYSSWTVTPVNFWSLFHKLHIWDGHSRTFMLLFCRFGLVFIVGTSKKIPRAASELTSDNSSCNQFWKGFLWLCSLHIPETKLSNWISFHRIIHVPQEFEHCQLAFSRYHLYRFPVLYSSVIFTSRSYDMSFDEQILWHVFWQEKSEMQHCMKTARVSQEPENSLTHRLIAENSSRWEWWTLITIQTSCVNLCTCY